ncbi:transposable element Tcb1 transposase [Trichonephila clavipes]|nr:transposable element Tcb1 transposase [Trichonephila clavipes]
MLEETMDRRGQSLPTSRSDRKIVHTAIIYHAAISRTIAQQIQSVTQHSVPASDIRHRLQLGGMSARHPLLRLPLTENHRRLRRH